MSVVIVDTGGANLASLGFALSRLGVSAAVTRDAGRIRAAGHVLLPGVGAAGDTMRRLREDRLDEVIVSLRQPVLGICLGMQILARRSAEGDTACLGVIAGCAAALEPAPGRPVPHMGWNRVRHDGTGLFAGLPACSFFYFVHSYALPPSAVTTATADYGQPLSAAVRQDNFYGTQFHPERSGACGAGVLANFLNLAVATSGADDSPAGLGTQLQGSCN